MTPTFPIWLSAFAALNLWTILRFWQDKKRAQAGDRRVSESELLRLAMIGGSPGALFARRYFRHKTRKEPFSSRLLMICAFQVTGLIAWFFWI